MTKKAIYDKNGIIQHNDDCINGDCNVCAVKKSKHKHNWVKKENGDKYCSSCSAEKGLRIFFYQGYSGKPKCEATVDGVSYVVETEQISTLLKRVIDLYGYKIEKTKRQKYPRLVINSL